MIKRESECLLMRRELLHTLENMNDDTIRGLLFVCDKNEIEKIFTILQFSDKETIDRWSGIYARMYK